jgi:hypothetical protein
MDYPGGARKTPPGAIAVGNPGVLLVLADSGGIVGLAAALLRMAGVCLQTPLVMSRSPPFGLRLAAAQVLPQRRRKALPMAILLLARTVDHVERLRQLSPCGKDRRVAFGSI